MTVDTNATKPMLDTRQQIVHLKNKGISFEICSEEEAFDYLRNNNNFFKLVSYRKNYDKYQGGSREGQYINLDFGFLKDLAIIDMQLRYTLVQLALDIEHYAKLELLRAAEDHQEDGYTICDDFVRAMDQKQKEMFMHEIARNERSLYCRALVERYPERLPMWVLLELIPFGRMVSFYRYCAGRYESKILQDRHFLLKSCKELRNAAAHSSCIINDLRPATKEFHSRHSVMNELAKIPELSKSMRRKRMSNARIQQIVTLLYVHNQIVTSAQVHYKTQHLLHDLKKRMLKNIDYYTSNNLVESNFIFLKTVIDNWF